MLIRNLKDKNPLLFKTIKNMPLRARVGRKNTVLKNGSVCFIRDNKRDAFIYIKPNNEMEELTFLETVRQFEATSTEKGIPLHLLHHEQVKKAVLKFNEVIENEKSFDKKVDSTQGPNEKNAIIYLDALLHLPYVNDKERERIILAKESIRKGKFQNLHRDINKLSRSVKKVPLNPVLILEKVIGIINSYPLGKVENESEQEMPKFNPTMIKPEIIITESFGH